MCNVIQSKLFSQLDRNLMEAERIPLALTKHVLSAALPIKI